MNVSTIEILVSKSSRYEKFDIFRYLLDRSRTEYSKLPSKLQAVMIGQEVDILIALGVKEMTAREMIINSCYSGQEDNYLVVTDICVMDWNSLINTALNGTEVKIYSCYKAPTDYADAVHSCRLGE